MFLDDLLGYSMMLLSLFTGDKPDMYHMGNCSYADKVALNWKCTGEVTKDLSYRWEDGRAKSGTDYAVWESSDGTVFVSFKKSDLFDYKTIKVNALDYKIYAEKNGKDVEVELKGDSVNCYAYGLRYVSDLKNSCLDLDYNPDDIVDHPILHYTK